MKSHSSVFDTTHIISSKKRSRQYEDFTFEDSIPFLSLITPSHDEFAAIFSSLRQNGLISISLIQIWKL